jgi:hypothetical protein
VAGPCEHGKVYSGSVKGGELLYLLRDYQVLKEDSVA